MSYLFRKKLSFTFLLNVSIILAFIILDQKYIMAAKEVHNFQLSSGFKDASDMRSREIIFMAKHPGTIKIDASWTPVDKKLTMTLYDQKKKALVAKKDKSPLSLVYDYTQEHFKKSKHLGNSFRIEISQSPFKSINGTIKIETPDKGTIEKENDGETRGPYGTFIKEENTQN
ncbi:MAG: hypothetical protein ACE5KZ_03260 [Candidatus Scalinduaceae bacterium]